MKENDLYHEIDTFPTIIREIVGGSAKKQYLCSLVYRVKG